MGASSPPAPQNADSSAEHKPKPRHFPGGGFGPPHAVGTLWRAEGEKVRCLACGHRCLIASGRRGICKVRFNQDGELRVPFGYVAGVASATRSRRSRFSMSIPGSDALTFGMLGCDFHCAYCQNWVTSQALRDQAARRADSGR